MIDNLKIALKRQKKLILIFLLTIFIPAISLSVFGIRAIRSERFRLAQQLENEHRRAADFIRTQVDTCLDELELVVQNLAHSPALKQKNFPEAREALKNQLNIHPLVEYIILQYRDERPWFPSFQASPSGSRKDPPEAWSEAQTNVLKRAEEAEFRQKQYAAAQTLYDILFSQAESPSLRAQMLLNIGRCFMKSEDFENSIRAFQKILDDHQDALSPSGLPLLLAARLQIIQSYKQLEDLPKALDSSLFLFRDVLKIPTGLSTDRFFAYASMAQEQIEDFLSEGSSLVNLEEKRNEYATLQGLFKLRVKQTEELHDLEHEICPELTWRLEELDLKNQSGFRYQKSLSSRDFLILAAPILDETKSRSIGLFSASLNIDYLIDPVFSDIVGVLNLDGKTEISVSDLEGKLLLGEEKTSSEATLTEFFKDGFPPWRLDFFRSKPNLSGPLNITKSFYFWTVLTLIVILIFGAFLISRALAQEMDVLKIKSDFVSSVSHELKTPLTSIKALLERLQSGKVKGQPKMQEYFSVLSQDTQKLTRLVKNILDFSRIEERKREYDFVETDTSSWLVQQIEGFQKEAAQEGVVIQAQIAEDLPPLWLDREAMSQALNNLFGNAVKFSSHEKKIQFTAKKDEGNVVLQVTDKGIGIPQDELDRIFDKFFQGRKALQHSVKGTGLGLTLVKHIIEAQGGKITVSSNLGEGSTFTVILPVKPKE